MQVPSLEALRQHYMNRRFRKEEPLSDLEDDDMFGMINHGIK